MMECIKKQNHAITLLDSIQCIEQEFMRMKMWLRVTFPTLLLLLLLMMISLYWNGCEKLVMVLWDTITVTCMQ
jgi:hypothetical protein